MHRATPAALSILTYNERWSGQTSDRAMAGEAWNAIEQRWHSFSVDLETGTVDGGVYLEIIRGHLAYPDFESLRADLGPRSQPTSLPFMPVLVAVGAEAWGSQGFSNLDLKPHGEVSLGDPDFYALIARSSASELRVELCGGSHARTLRLPAGAILQRSRCDWLRA